MNGHGRCLRSRVMGPGWNPWAALRQREHLTLRWARLRGCREVIVDRPEGRTIYLEASLCQRDRNALLAHALVHDERTLYDPDAPQALVDHEEAQVRRITTDRLVPPRLLECEIERLISLGDPVHAVAIVDIFDVPIDVAHHALHLMQVRERS